MGLKFTDFDEITIWTKVYVATIRRGSIGSRAVLEADFAVEAYRARIDK